jgi:hypothetical protein
MLVLLTCQAALADSAVGHFRALVRGRWVDVVQVNLQDRNVRIVPIVAPSYYGKQLRAPFKTFMESYQPVAAINGTFFDTRTFRVTGNVVVDGHMLREGYIGNAVAFDRDNFPSLIRNTGHLGRHTDWSRYGAAIGGGPTLLEDGLVTVNPRGEGFKDRGLLRAATRSAVGFTAQRKLLLVSVPYAVSFNELARIMSSLGADTAISLDGGSSAGLYYRGKMLTSPRRSLTNVLAVFERRGPTSMIQGGGPWTAPSIKGPLTAAAASAVPPRTVPIAKP